MRIKTQISVGELVDKLTILEIKKQKISDPQKLENIVLEYSELNKLYKGLSSNAKICGNLLDLIALKADLFEVNMSLWITEDNIRQRERFKDFGPEFIRLARNIYQANDMRFHFKNKINILFNSNIKEEKSYESYS